MEDHGSSHSLLQSPAAGTAATTLAYAWGYQQQPSAPFDEHCQDDTGGGDQQQQLDLTTAPELRLALVRALAELHASRAAHQAELRRMESEAARRSCPPRPPSGTMLLPLPSAAPPPTGCNKSEPPCC